MAKKTGRNFIILEDLQTEIFQALCSKGQDLYIRRPDGWVESGDHGVGHQCGEENIDMPSVVEFLEPLDVQCWQSSCLRWDHGCAGLGRPVSDSDMHCICYTGCVEQLAGLKQRGTVGN